MIFRHMQMSLDMRNTRTAKQNSVHGVLLHTAWFCPYCCATVDTAFVTMRSTASGCVHPFV